MSAIPQLLVVVDTEEEFDWNGSFSRENRSTRSIPAQAAAHAIYDRFGVVPTYVVGYPVATDPGAAAFLGALRKAGKAAIGAHLHPWVTPPHEEVVSRRNSYQCNLPPELEARKISALTDAIEQGFGERPTIFKAGRYGFGDNTLKVLVELGYRIDCSFVPHTSFAGDGGPSYYRVSNGPRWLDADRGLLEVPLTGGYIGRLSGCGPRMQPLFDHALARRTRLPGMLARSGLLGRARLSPEGIPAEEQCALIETLWRRGQRLFSLTYHSPSLAPGNTPYVRTEKELAAFLTRIETVLAFFRDQMGGRFTTLDEVYEQEVAAFHIMPRRRAVYG